jgi:hypothetical protein
VSVTSRGVAPSTREVDATLVGDDAVPDAAVVMDRAFTLRAPPVEVWPWFAQMGKGRSGWYLPRSVERLMPRRRRAIRHVEPSLQLLAVGDVIADWGGADATFQVAVLDPPCALVHVSTRGNVRLSWAITLDEEAEATRVHLRLRLGGVRHPRLVAMGGGFIDWMTVVGLAAGLRERLGHEVRTT